MSFEKRIKRKQEKALMKHQFKKSAKHRCPLCHRFSLFNKKPNGDIICVACNKVIL